MNLERLLKYGYFPKKLPPPFTTYPFGEFATQSLFFPKIKENYITSPLLHNLARPSNQRRQLSIPNPFNYFQLAKHISENADLINACILKSNISLSKPTIDDKNFRSYVPERDGKELPEIRIRNRAGARFILRTDILRFYHSVYTHCIPWAAMGKKEAKKERRVGFANKLDQYLRNAQDGQTLGIPVGPDTSFIIAELIGAAIDEQIQNQNLKGFRFIDDFEFVFISKSEAEIAQPIIEQILGNFELALNPSKTIIDQLPISVDNSWRLKIRGFNLNFIQKNSLIEYFDLLFDLHNSNKTEPVLRYGISRLRSVNFGQTDLLLDLLFQCILVEPGTLKETLGLIEKLNIKFKKEDFGEMIYKLISAHGPLKHGSEVAWAIWSCIFLEITIPPKISSELSNYEDSIIGLLALHAGKKGLLDTKTLTPFGELMKQESLKDGNWLLAYEADLKKWLPSKDQKNHVESDPYFAILKQHNISFYDENITSAISSSDLEDKYNDDTDNKDFDTLGSFSNDDLPF